MGRRGFLTVLAGLVAAPFVHGSGYLGRRVTVRLHGRETVMEYEQLLARVLGKAGAPSLTDSTGYKHVFKLKVD